MQTANILLALSGDRGNTVPKYDVTAAEVAVLRYVHGEDAVFDVEITGDVQRTHRQEIGRLTELYGRQEGERRVAPAVAELFPGAAARVFEAFDELEIPDELYIASGRKTSAPEKQTKKAASEPEGDDDLDELKVKELQALADKENVDLAGVTRRADIIEAIRLNRAKIAAEQDDDEAEENVGEMTDANLFN